MKGKVAARNLTFKFKDVQALVDDAIGDITSDEWKSCVKHVETVESRYYASDIAVDKEMDRICFVVDSSDEGTDTASEGEYSGTTDSASATESATEGEDIA
jgi:hypothetical protein